MKTYSVDVQGQLAEEYRRPIYLLEMQLNAATLRFARSKTNIIFPAEDGYTFYARYFDVPDKSTNLEGQIGRITLKIDNTDDEMAAYAAAENFEGKIVNIYLVYRDALSDVTNYVDWFSGVLENPSSINHESLEVSAIEGSPLGDKAVNWEYNKLCPWIFGSVECNVDGNADLSSLVYSGTASGGSISTLICSGLSSTNDYWNCGSIAMVIDGTTYKRVVKDYDQASTAITFDVALPVTVSPGTTFTVYKGCDHTRETCNHLNAWGPSADNVLNYGGFLHIGSAQKIYYTRR